MNWFQRLREKLNPAQGVISREEGSQVASTIKINYYTAFKQLEAVNRGVSMIVSGASALDYDIKNKLTDGNSNLRVKQVYNLLNVRPNPYQNVQEFRSACFLDFVLEGNIFIYFDGSFFYHLPSSNVQVVPDPKSFVSHYLYNNEVKFDPTEVIHIKDLNSDSIYRGSSRLQAADSSIKLLSEMKKFQHQFFENGAVPGLALGTDNTLSVNAKNKTLDSWVANYNPKRNGAKRPIIIDSGLKPIKLFDSNFQELEFNQSIKAATNSVLESLGVPALLVEGGNNANISPNLRLFYLETVMPVVRKFVSAMESFTGYDIDAVTYGVQALQPELSQLASYHVSLVNSGVITPDEARAELRYGALPDGEGAKIRVPVNIAGSAVNPSQGGRPPEGE
jgi:HK97 family phage portal protein